MEFLDEEAKPRFLFQSRAIPPTRPETETLNLRKPSVLVSLSISVILFGVSIFFLQSEPLRSISIWFALSLLVGPFAPSSVTAGDISVGVGKVVEPPLQNDVVDQEDQKKKTPNRRSRARKNEELRVNPAPAVVEEPKRVHNSLDSLQREGNSGIKTVIEGGEREWSDGDVDLLKKLLIKHPVGKPKRWEAIAEAFQGRHGVESVIKMAKLMREKRTSDADSFAQFLRDRKPVDTRIEAGSEVVEGVNGTVGSGELNMEIGGVNWSAGDDMALLNALKAFPKDAAMRWEKIAAAVPGKTKAACMKRVAELKKDFRSSKASAEA